MNDLERFRIAGRLDSEYPTEEDVLDFGGSRDVDSVTEAVLLSFEQHVRVGEALSVERGNDVFSLIWGHDLVFAPLQDHHGRCDRIDAVDR